MVALDTARAVVASADDNTLRVVHMASKSFEARRSAASGSCLNFTCSCA